MIIISRQMSINAQIIANMSINEQNIVDYCAFMTYYLGGCAHMT